MERTRITGYLRHVVALMPIVMVTSCGISPKPEPPDSVPIIDLSQVTAQEPSDGNPLAIEGGPGAADPPGAVVRATNLDSQSPPLDGEVAEDGSFSLDLELMFGDEIRLQVIDGAHRSEPADFVVGSGKSPALPPSRPLENCWRLSPAKQANVETVSSIVVRNDCEEEVSVEAPWSRRSVAGLTIGDALTWPAVMAPGASITVTFEVPPAEFEEVVFLRSTAPETDRRPITLYRP
jgi:hypothetical protein